MIEYMKKKIIEMVIKEEDIEKITVIYRFVKKYLD